MGAWFASAVNWLINGIGAALLWVINLLPDSPFASPSAPPSSLNLGYVTWILDFPTWLSHLAVLLTAIITFYSIRVAARWLKVAAQ